MISPDDAKVMAANTTSIVMVFAQIESILTIAVLLASLIYTIQKIIKHTKQ